MKPKPSKPQLQPLSKSHKDVHKITSLTHDLVKQARRLHLRKHREETGLFLAEGLKILIDALNLGYVPQFLIFSDKAKENPKLDHLIIKTQDAGGEVYEVTEAILQKISQRENTQSVIGLFQQNWACFKNIVPSTASCWIALEEVRDPGNLGTIIRTADAAGCGGVFLIGNCCDPFSLEAVRATMGSIFALPIMKLSPEQGLDLVKSWSGAVIATRLDATQSYLTASYAAPNLLLMGQEQKGLSRELSEIAHFSVKIPMRGQADSLNLAIATAIMIYRLCEV